MSVLTALYMITIRPLELLFEVIFAVSYKIVPNPGINLLIMSLLINFLVLPLYNRADKLQAETRKTEERLSPMIEHIKKYFKGDERIMMLQTYYDQNHYHPLSALKSSVSLILQIPFFMAAYRFLSNLPLLQGEALGPIKDLSLPDNLIVIGGITLNLLPIAMTIINIVSCEIYTKGQPFKSKITMYVMALFFLVFLYTCPSGLVLYWTLNNVFSLFKNIFLKLKRPGFALCVLCAATGVVVGFAALLKKASFTDRQFGFLIGLGIAMLLPLAFALIRPLIKKEISPVTKVEKGIFWASAVYLTLFVGFLIPSDVVSYSPDEFVDSVLFHNPSRFVWITLFIAAGFFIVWFGMYFLLASDKAKKVFASASWMMAIIATVDYLFFGTALGNLSPDLQFDNGLVFKPNESMINLAVIALCIIVPAVIYSLFPKVTRFIALSGAVAIAGLGIYNLKKINDNFNELKFYNSEGTEVAKITLSATGQNVVVIMIDRAIGAYVPYIFNEKPELYDQFDGFTYYPNMVSFGCHTNFGAPAVWGGYDYTPQAMNARPDEPLVDKHNEALTMLPRLFSEHDFYTTVFDPPFANYSWAIDTSIYDDYDDIHAYRAEGMFNEFDGVIAVNAEQNRERNFFFYSLMKAVPVICQTTVYNDGQYNSLDVRYDGSSEEEVAEEFTSPQEHDGMSIATGVNPDFINCYTTVASMPYITNITEDEDDAFFIMCTEMPHSTCLLQEPDYVPAQNVDNTEYDAENMDRFTVDGRTMDVHRYGHTSHYEVNMATYLTLGKWFEYLQEQGVWDNTRIILVSDHGYELYQFEDMIFFDETLDAEFVNAVLMVKDFNATGFTTSDELMTTADVATLATDGTIEDPVNPFTGNPINSDYKDDGTIEVFFSHDYKPQDNNGNVYNVGPWYSVHDNIFEEANWEYLGEY